MSRKGAVRRAGPRSRSAQNELREAVAANVARKQTAVYSDDFDGRKNEERCLESQNEGYGRKNNEECSAAEEVRCCDSDHCQDLSMCEAKGVSVTLNQRKKKPASKLRVCKPRSNSASGDHCRTPPRPRSVLRKSAPVKYNQLRSEGKVAPRNELSSFLAPSSVTTLNARASPKKTMLAESPNPEGPQLESTSPPLSSNFTSHSESSGDSNLSLCGEAPPAKDESENISISDLKLEDDSSKTPSVIEATTTTVPEKTKELEKSTDDSSNKKEKIVQEQIVTATIQEVSVDGQSEHVEAKSTSEDSVREQNETKATVLQKPRSSSFRSLSSSYLKKKVKTVPPQYLGTLKVLEDKRLQKNSTEFDNADSVRAAVFQNWLEKKRAFLLELKNAEKKKAEKLRSDAEKKEAAKREEAITSFKAWEAMKAREAKKLNEKKKLEKLKEKKAAEQNAEKAEAAQKAFEKWKEKKTEYLREQSRQEKQSERMRKKEEEKLAEEKKRDSISAVEKWNDEKEEYIKQKKAEKILERRKQEIQQTKKNEKDKMAMEEYERWLYLPLVAHQILFKPIQEKIKRREQLEKKQKKLQAVRGAEVRSPWNPPGKVTYGKNY